MTTHINYEIAGHILKSCDNIYILTHQNPDGDTIGSGFALYYALISMGKKAKVLCSDNFHDKYSYITQSHIDTDFEPDYIISTDVADTKLLGTLKEQYGDKVYLCIDHHISNVEYSKYLLVSPNSSATCEVIYKLLNVMGTPLNDMIAKSLYTGIATDTGCFKFSNCNAETHRIVSEIMEQFPNINYAHINRLMFDVKSVGRLKAEREALDNLQYYLNGKCSVLCITNEMITRLNMTLEDFEGITGLSTQTEGVEVGVTMKEIEPDTFKISLRSVNDVDVSKICQKFGGGGHIKAGGCKIENTPYQKTINMIVNAIAEELFYMIKDGILCMNKPQGFTSFDVIGKLRGILKMKRLGHSGTLDPMATGVLPIFVGKATKCCDILPNDDKSYIAGFKLGSITDTQDSTGIILKEYPHKDISTKDIESILSKFIGNIDQIPPMYSAVSINGKRLYELARKNIIVERPSRKVTIYDIKLLSYDEKTQTGELNIYCGKGTYVRTIINDIGEALQVGGYMTSLVRTSASGFSLDECYSFEDIEKAVSNDSIDSLIIPTERIFSNIPKIHLTEVQTKAYRNGTKLPLGELSLIDDIKTYTIYSHDDIFIGTANVDLEENVLRIGKNF